MKLINLTQCNIFFDILLFVINIKYIDWQLVLENYQYNIISNNFICERFNEEIFYMWRAKWENKSTKDLSEKYLIIKNLNEVLVF